MRADGRFIPPISSALSNLSGSWPDQQSLLVQAVAASAKPMKETCVTMDGTVVGVNRGSATVELANGAVVRGVIAGKLMKHRIRIVAGDRVQVEMTPSDLTKGRITCRFNRL